MDQITQMHESIGEDVASVNEAYGQLKANLFIAGFTLERAFRNFLEPLLVGDGWKLCGIGFDDVNAFMDSLRLDKFRMIAAERKQIAQRIKELQPAVSNRQIARTLGVRHDTIDRDLGRGANAPENNDEPKDDRGSNGANAPLALSGREAGIEQTGQPKDYVTLDEWRETTVADRAAMLGRVGKRGLNKQDNTDIEWANWSWNPVTGCLHGCPYCYARNIAFDIYPTAVGFSPTLWPDRLTAPQNQKASSADTGACKNIFTCSMADLFGRWVPDEWIGRVLAEVAANPQWNFLFLTKFPKRMAEFEIPLNAWMGTTVDLQARVANAEKAFERVKAGIRWLSIEPMIQPLQFNRLDLFDWIVIGGASPSGAVDGTPATPAWTIPIDWIVDLHQQARAADCKIYYKTNSGLSGLTRIREYPGHQIQDTRAPDVFDYLRNIPGKEQVG